MADTSASQEPLPPIVLIAEHQGVVAILLSDLENALTAYAQNQGQASEPQQVNIVLNGPIMLGALLPKVEIVTAQQAGGKEFLLSDLEYALTAYKQSLGQVTDPQYVSIYSRLDDPSGGGGQVPK